MKVFTCSHKSWPETWQQCGSWGIHETHKPLTCLCDGAIFTWWLIEKNGSSEAAYLLQVGIAVHFVGGHFLWGPLQYLWIFSLAWLNSVCFGWIVQKWQCYTFCAKCLSNPAAALCRLSPAGESFPLCSDLCHLLFICTAGWGSSTTGDWTFIFSVPQQRQTCPIFYSSPYSNKWVSFSPSMARLCLKLFPLLLSLFRTAEMNTEV